jgi:hypothetical protein
VSTQNQSNPPPQQPKQRTPEDLYAQEDDHYLRRQRQYGGRSKSAAKVAAARENGKLGGRPSLERTETQLRRQLGLSDSEPIEIVKILVSLNAALANQFPGGLHPLWTTAFSRRTR